MGYSHQKRFNGGNVNHGDYHYGEIDLHVVHVSNLTKDTLIETIKAELSKFGHVEQVAHKQARTWTEENNSSVWYAFVKFSTPEGAASAVRARSIIIDGTESFLRPRKIRPYYQEDNQHRSDNHYTQKGKDHYQSDPFKSYQTRDSKEASNSKGATDQPPLPKKPEGPSKSTSDKQHKTNTEKKSAGKADKKGDDKDTSKSTSKVQAQHTNETVGPLNPQNASYFEPGAICQAPSRHHIERQTNSSPSFVGPQPQTQVEKKPTIEATPSDSGDAKFSMVVKYIPPYYDRAYFDQQCITLCEFPPKSMHMFTDGVTRLAIITGETREQANQIFKSLNALRVDPNHTLRLVWLSEEDPMEDNNNGTHGVEKPKTMPSYSVPYPATSSPDATASAKNGLSDNNNSRLRDANYSPVTSEVPYTGFEHNPASIATPYLAPSISAHPRDVPYRRFENAVQQHQPQPFGPPAYFLSPQILPLQRTTSISTTGRGTSPPANFSQTRGNGYPSFNNHFTAPNSRLPSPSMMAPPMRQPVFDGPFRYPSSFAPPPGPWSGPPAPVPPMPPSHLAPQFMGPMGIVDRSPNFFDNHSVAGMVHMQGMPPSQYGQPMLGAPSNPVFNSQVPQEMSREFPVPFATSYHIQNEAPIQNPTQATANNETVANLPLNPQDGLQDLIEAGLQHIPDSKDPDDLTLLFVKNLDDDVVSNDKELKELFAPYGEIESVELRTYENGRSKNFGFVKFVNAEDAKKVKDSLHEQMNGKKRMFISYAEPKEQREKRLNAIFKGQAEPPSQETTASEDSPPQSIISQDDVIQPATRRTPSPDISDNGKTNTSALTLGTSQAAMSSTKVENNEDSNSRQDKIKNGNSGSSTHSAGIEEQSAAIDNKPNNTSEAKYSGHDDDTSIKPEAVAHIEHNDSRSPGCPADLNVSRSPRAGREPVGETIGRPDSHNNKLQQNTIGSFVNDGHNIPRMMDASPGHNFFRGEHIQGQLHPPNIQHTNSPPWEGHRNQAHHLHSNAMGNTPLYPNGHQHHSNNYKGRSNWYTNKHNFGRGNGNAPQFRPSRFPRETLPSQAYYVPHNFQDTLHSEKVNPGYLNNGMMPRHQYGHMNRNENHGSLKRELQQPKYNDEFANFNNTGQGRTPLLDSYHGPQSMPSNRHTGKKKRGGISRDFSGGNSHHQASNPKTEASTAW